MPIVPAMVATRTAATKIHGTVAITSEFLISGMNWAAPRSRSTRFLGDVIGATYANARELAEPNRMAALEL